MKGKGMLVEVAENCSGLLLCLSSSIINVNLVFNHIGLIQIASDGGLLTVTIMIYEKENKFKKHYQ
jgi:hypothetical protein